MKGVLLLLFVAFRVSGGQAKVAVQGVAYDSLHRRPLVGAFIAIEGTTRTAISDSAGRFSIEGVTPGTIKLLLQHDVLDAIGIPAVARHVTVTDGRTPITVAVPSFLSLWSAACADPPADTEHGLLFGKVGGRKEPARQPIAVSASWVELVAQDGKTVQRQAKIAEAHVDSTGRYTFCGVPTHTALQLRAANASSEYGTVVVLPFAADRIAKRDLTLGAPLDSIVIAKRGATLMGKVVDSSRAPIADAQVLVPALNLGTQTDRHGNFRIDNLRPGTFLISVRKIGYAIIDEHLEFGEAMTTSYTASLKRVVTLDSVAVTARRTSRDEAMRLFDENRRLGLGRFLTREDLEKQGERRMIDILSQFPGLKPERGMAGQGYMMSSRGIKSINEPCEATKQDHEKPSADAARLRRAGQSPPLPCSTSCFVHVFLDGVDISPTEVPNINRFNPLDLEGVEYYAGGAQVPAEYNRLNASRCGLIVLHTRRGPGRRP